MNHILRNEDVVRLTDRWGDRIDGAYDNYPVSLLEKMFDELTFIVERNGQLGVLYEYEWATPGSDHDEDVASCWGRPMTLAQVETAAETLVEKLRPMFPQAQLYASHHDGNFWGRMEIRAFVPAEHASEELFAAIDRAVCETSCVPHA